MSRSLAACEGALLVVDCAQGVEAQSVASATAIEQGLEVLPVLNKIDLPQRTQSESRRKLKRLSDLRLRIFIRSVQRPARVDALLGF